MRSAIDTNVIVALFGSEPLATFASELLDRVRGEGALAICGVVYAELLACPGMEAKRLVEFLGAAEIETDFESDNSFWHETGIRFARYAARRRRAKAGSQKRLLADFMIGAHALLRADRLVTFNETDFRVDFPGLMIFPARRSQ